MNEVDLVAEYCKSLLPLGEAQLGEEYGYKCLSLCVIDAVWSIGVRYGSVQNVVSRYSTYFNLSDIKVLESHSLNDLILEMQKHGVDWFANHVFQNRQRTSTQSGILKAEAVYLFASILQRHGILMLHDVPQISWYEDLYSAMRKPYAREILSLPGQSSGIALTYFYMLTGSSGIVKPDRMVNGFLQEVLHRTVTDEEAQYLLSHASRVLNAEFSTMTPRLLDHEVWKFQSGRYSVSKRCLG